MMPTKHKISTTSSLSTVLMEISVPYSTIRRKFKNLKQKKLFVKSSQDISTWPKKASFTEI